MPKSVSRADPTAMSERRPGAGLRTLERRHDASGVATSLVWVADEHVVDSFPVHVHLCSDGVRAPVLCIPRSLASHAPCVLIERCVPIDDRERRQESDLVAVRFGVEVPTQDCRNRLTDRATGARRTDPRRRPSGDQAQAVRRRASQHSVGQSAACHRASPYRDRHASLPHAHAVGGHSCAGHSCAGQKRPQVRSGRRRRGSVGRCMPLRRRRRGTAPSERTRRG